jgi:hypothetical protein
MVDRASPLELDACHSLLRELTNALERYCLDQAVYPRSGNTNLVKSLLGSPPKMQVYFQFSKGILNNRGEVIDPWGHPIVYQNRADRRLLRNVVQAPFGSFLLYSRGPDGRGRIQSG